MSKSILLFATFFVFVACVDSTSPLTTEDSVPMSPPGWYDKVADSVTACVGKPTIRPSQAAWFQIVGVDSFFVPQFTYPVWGITRGRTITLAGHRTNYWNTIAHELAHASWGDVNHQSEWWSRCIEPMYGYGPDKIF